MPREKSNEKPGIIVVLSGKRKSGKDYIAYFLQERFGKDDSVILRLSGPLKERYALENNLNYEKLLDASEYKEIFREKMIKWGEAIRSRDPGYFCRHAIQQSQAISKRIWIVSDARRRTDMEFFKTTYPDETYIVRVNASDAVRQNRGWVYTKGVDDCESECGLDDFDEWNLQICNDDNEQMLEGISKLFLSTKMILK